MYKHRKRKVIQKSKNMTTKVYFQGADSATKFIVTSSRTKTVAKILQL